MDELDDILNDLHLTNVTLLRQKTNNQSFESTDYRQQPSKLQETTIDAYSDNYGDRPNKSAYSDIHADLYDSRYTDMGGRHDQGLTPSSVRNNDRYDNDNGEHYQYQPRSNTSSPYDFPPTNEPDLDFNDDGDTHGPSNENTSQELTSLMDKIDRITLDRQQQASDNGGPITGPNDDRHRLTRQQRQSYDPEVSGMIQSLANEMALNNEPKTHPRLQVREMSLPTPPETPDRDGAAPFSPLDDGYQLPPAPQERRSDQPVCAACQEPIAGTLIKALNLDWHPSHFVCTVCGRCLASIEFYESNQKAFCADCHANTNAPKCSQCGEAIFDNCIMAFGRKWHYEHFRCHGCDLPLKSDITVHEHNSHVYCADCYLRDHGIRCEGCKQPITGSYIMALNFSWHPPCFICRDCGKALNRSNFLEFNGEPFCDFHYHQRRGLLCAVCQKPIVDKFVSAMGQRYHPNHFTCAYCTQSLKTGTFKEHGGKPYCHKCHTQLFG